jgi:hypothetical protein
MAQRMGLEHDTWLQCGGFYRYRSKGNDVTARRYLPWSYLHVICGTSRWSHVSSDSRDDHTHDKHAYSAVVADHAIEQHRYVFFLSGRCNPSLCYNNITTAHLDKSLYSLYFCGCMQPMFHRCLKIIHQSATDVKAGFKVPCPYHMTARKTELGVVSLASQGYLTCQHFTSSQAIGETNHYYGEVESATRILRR